MNYVVVDIFYYGKDLGGKVKVFIFNGNEFFGDAVLITVLFGCLKVGYMKFCLLFSEWKYVAIKRLGFGVFNKLVLEFLYVFWDDIVDYFGVIVEYIDLRGRCFMFWNVKKIVGVFVFIVLLVGKVVLDG